MRTSPWRLGGGQTVLEDKEGVSNTHLHSW